MQAQHGLPPSLVLPANLCSSAVFSRRFPKTPILVANPRIKGGPLWPPPAFAAECSAAVLPISRQIARCAAHRSFYLCEDRGFSASYRWMPWHVTCTRLCDRVRQPASESMMSYTAFTAEQLDQEARADRQQNEVLRYWLLRECDRHRNHRNPGRVLTSGRAAYRACHRCPAKLGYSRDEAFLQRRACGGMRHATDRAI
jgi:hypothetical protein